MDSRGTAVVISIIWFIVTLVLNPGADFTVQPKACVYIACIVGEPVNVAVNFDKNYTGIVAVSSTAIEEDAQKQLTDAAQIDFNFPTKSDLKPGKYSITFKLNEPWSYLLVDPIKTAYNNLIGQSAIAEFKYPQITVNDVNRECHSNSMSFKQITLKNDEYATYNCKLRMSVNKDARVIHPDFSKTNSTDKRDIFDATIGRIERGKSTYGRDDVLIESPTCRDEILVEVIPVCLINNREIELADFNKKFTCRLDNCK